MTGAHTSGGGCGLIRSNAQIRTQQNLEIVRTDVERGLLFVKGSVPGHKGSWCLVKDAVKVPAHADLPYPAGLKQDASPATEAPAEAIENEVIEEAAVNEAPAVEETQAVEAAPAADTAAETAAPEGDAPAADESKEG